MIILACEKAKTFKNATTDSTNKSSTFSGSISYVKTQYFSRSWALINL